MVRIKFISVILTLVVLFLLIAAGPAHAFILGLTISENNLGEEKISFLASAKVDNQEIKQIDYFLLEIIGNKNISCKFSVNGTAIEDCENIVINKISEPDFGYGYGYNAGDFIYNITIDTESMQAGAYSTKLTSSTDKGVFEKSGEGFVINSEGLEGCSFRGDDGALMLKNSENIFSNKDHLSFYIPSKGAAKGEGYITSQSGKTTFSYTFNINKILRNDNVKAEVSTSGKSKLGVLSYKAENATITYNKASNTFDILGESFRISGIKLTFLKGCQKI